MSYDAHYRAHLAAWCNGQYPNGTDAFNAFLAILDYCTEHYPDGIGDRSWVTIRRYMEDAGMPLTAR